MLLLLIEERELLYSAEEGVLLVQDFLKISTIIPTSKLKLMWHPFCLAIGAQDISTNPHFAKAYEEMCIQTASSLCIASRVRPPKTLIDTGIVYRVASLQRWSLSVRWCDEKPVTYVGCRINLLYIVPLMTLYERACGLGTRVRTIEIKYYYELQRKPF